MRADEITPASDAPLLLADKPEIRVILAAPRGFCAGVRRAIDAVRDALAKHGAPVFVRRAIVHNLEVVRSLEAEGAIFVEELDEIPPGAVVVFSAHGVAPAIAADARRRDLTAYDAVCPLVAKVHREVERHQRHGRQIILIGHKGHPEIEGTLGHVSSVGAHVVNSLQEVAALPVGRDEPAAYAVQTTYSVDDAHAIVEALRERFADLEGPASSDICYATTNRQAAVREVAIRSDAIIVVGEHFSSNACRLAEVAGAHCGEVQLVAGPDDIDWECLPASGVIGITAAASTPESSVQAILSALAGRYRISVEQTGSEKETTVFKRMALA
ncbi:4-hydroxy-3-methylbut-2-enyl diphosphate reductase [Sphingomonas daechungensis]|uniref:4-hydroxy-3-methylbut-2-enyl diphosphate reductase n=1 Tax=Sphingomonas daechungensis TaxID=1176646 RepID=UPI001CB8ED38|nr:4-hydroxy-3-methylbut-2-enyl diphosphate reductase [Sphingomonas daechungensis]